MRFTEFISEAGSPGQQAAIAIAMKKAGKKPKGVAEGSEQQLVTIYTNPAYKGATVDDRIKKSLPVTEAPFNKLQMWENGKSMKDPKVAQWVNNNLLPQLKQNGKLGPLVVWNNKGKLFVIDGNHRFIAYQAAGYNGNVPVQIVPDKMINIVDTVPGQQGVAEEWSQKYKSSINCSHPKGFSQKAHCAGKKKHNESIMMEMVCEDCGMCQTHGDHENLDEACWSTHKQVGMKNKGGKQVPNCVPKESTETTDQVLENLHKWFKEKWVRFGPDGKIRGDCARGSESEGKPKCLPQSKAHSLGKKGRASAAARKRREDPNANRSGKAINVSTKGKGK